MNVLLYFHAFRKTFQTWGAVHGVGQRSAQELLGHSDPSLTANVYTDVAALALHDEVAKLPWVGGVGGVQKVAQKPVIPCTPLGLSDTLSHLIHLAQVIVSEGETSDSEAKSLAARHGFEP